MRVCQRRNVLSLLMVRSAATPRVSNHVAHAKAPLATVNPDISAISTP
jgi:hypothetical protein